MLSNCDRRTYSVPHPNYITYGILIAIISLSGGHSRTITYLTRADNNRASTVLHNFQQAVSQYGHVRSDHGGENIAVWRYIVSNHSLDYSQAITGSSGT